MSSEPLPWGKVIDQTRFRTFRDYIEGDGGLEPVNGTSKATGF